MRFVLRPGNDAPILGLLMHVNDELAGWRTIRLFFSSPAVTAIPPSDWGRVAAPFGPPPLILAATHPPRLSEVVDMWRAEHDLTGLF